MLDCMESDALSPTLTVHDKAQIGQLSYPVAVWTLQILENLRCFISQQKRPFPSVLHDLEHRSFCSFVNTQMLLTIKVLS